MGKLLVITAFGSGELELSFFFDFKFNTRIRTFLQVVSHLNILDQLKTNAQLQQLYNYRYIIVFRKGFLFMGLLNLLRIHFCHV